MRNVSSPKCPPPANRASVSNRSYPNRSPTPEATSPKECRCEERTGCLSGRLDQGSRGRPPFGLGFGGNKRGSIKSHKSSGSMAVRIAVHLHPVLLFEPCLVADVGAHETIPANGVAAAVPANRPPRKAA